MSKPFKNLVNKMSPAAQKKALAKTESLLKEIPLQELRRGRSVSQEYLATALATKQANISRMERRADMCVSTLRNYIEAMGGKLNVIAEFPEGKVKIKFS